MSIYGKFLSSSDEKTSISNTSVKRDSKVKKSVLLKESKRNTSKKNRKLNEEVVDTYYGSYPPILSDKMKDIYNILDKYGISYEDSVEVSYYEQDGEEYYDYLGVFNFDEEVDDKTMSELEKEIQKEFKYSEVHPNDDMSGLLVTLGGGDEDDLFESKKSKAKNKKVNENVYDIEHLVLFPEDLTDDEEYSRTVLLGSLGNISELTDTMGDIYITSMKEVPEDKNEPYNSKARVTITFEGDDVNEVNLEKIIEFINSETAFEMAQIEGENKISFDFDPNYV